MKNQQPKPTPKTKPKPSPRLEFWPAADVRACKNPKNWRTHPPAQVQALRKAIDTVGWAGAVIFNQRTNRIIDGHLRADIGDEKVPVLIFDVAPRDEDTILATFDPLAQLATGDRHALDALIKQIRDDPPGELTDEDMADLDASFNAARQAIEDQQTESRRDPKFWLYVDCQSAADLAQLRTEYPDPAGAQVRTKLLNTAAPGR